MTNVENAPATVRSAQPTAKKLRRGINNDTKAVALLKFHEKDSAPNMLFVGHLKSVSVEWSTNSDGKQFTGMSIPRIVLHFASNHKNETEQRHLFRNINPVESNVNTIPNGTEEWKVTNVFRWIKHILDTFYLKGREFTVQEEEALTLPFVDFDEQGQYVPVETEEVLAGYRFIFENAVAMLNGQFNLKDGGVAKPTYKSADGKPIAIWMKLLRHKKRKNKWYNVGNNGELDFDNFIGDGVIEIVKKGENPTILRVDLAKESITPKEVDNQPTVGVPGMPIGGVMPGVGMDMGTANNSAFADASSDMPF